MTASPHPHKYLNGLNGLRALAAGTVLLRHIHDGLPALRLPFWGRTKGCFFAVSVFFALSGFLIPHSLLREKETNGKIGTKELYLRRTLWIWPLYFLFFGCALLLNHLVDEAYDKSLILSALVFAGHIPNCLNHSIGKAGPLWSLGAEGQIHLIGPCLIRFANRPIVALSAFLILFFVVKGIARLAFGEEHPVYYFFYISRFDFITMGGIAACLHLRGIPAQLKTILFSLPVQIVCLLGLLAVIPDKFHVSSFLDHFLITVVTAVLMFNLITNPRPLLYLETRLLRVFGAYFFWLVKAASAHCRCKWIVVAASSSSRLGKNHLFDALRGWRNDSGGPSFNGIFGTAFFAFQRSFCSLHASSQREKWRHCDKKLISLPIFYLIP